MVRGRRLGEEGSTYLSVRKVHEGSTFLGLRVVPIALAVGRCSEAADSERSDSRGEWSPARSAKVNSHTNSSTYSSY